MSWLLFELGTEEIPAGYIEPALEAMTSSLTRRLGEARIESGQVRGFATPRRLAVAVEGLSPRQAPVTSELVGPPVQAGYDEKGLPTVAAVRFAEKAGIPVGKLSARKTAKGMYLCATLVDPGFPTRKVLVSLLPEVIASVPFPKSMRWSDLPAGFARPVHGILALFDGKVVPFTWNGLRSAGKTRGHFLMDPGTISVKDPAHYLASLEKAHVLADISSRKDTVRSEIARVAHSLGGKVADDQELVDTVTHLVEYPVAVGGRFDTEFLEIPSEVLITAMREHQKYFAVVGDGGHLLPCFIAVNNTRVKDEAVAARGHERVLRARLDDARFFYRADRQQPMERWVERLKGVLFQSRLGSVYDKVERVREMARYLAWSLEKEGGASGLTEPVTRAAWLCKADLTSQVVVEFPKLQGVMGGVYARLAGEPEPVCRAVEEHYRPTSSGGTLPVTLPGAVLALADKCDSLCGCFSVGLVPTGTSDPYALRRQAIGIIQILRNLESLVSLEGMLEKNLDLVEGKAVQDGSQTRSKLLAFLRDRMAHLLTEEGYPKDIIAAATAVSIDPVPHLFRRVEALARLMSAPDFEPLATAFKRVVNIVRQADAGEGAPASGTPVDRGLFEKKCESDLWEAYLTAQRSVQADVQQGLFTEALSRTAALREPVDAFFEGVMVMAEDEKLRNNRLSLLRSIAGLFWLFADFSKIAA